MARPARRLGGRLRYVSQLAQAAGVGLALEAHRRSWPHTAGSLYWQLERLLAGGVVVGRGLLRALEGAPVRGPRASSRPWPSSPTGGRTRCTSGSPPTRRCRARSSSVRWTWTDATSPAARRRCRRRPRVAGNRRDLLPGRPRPPQRRGGGVDGREPRASAAYATSRSSWHRRTSPFPPRRLRVAVRQPDGDAWDVTLTAVPLRLRGAPGRRRRRGALLRELRASPARRHPARARRPGGAGRPTCPPACASAPSRTCRARKRAPAAAMNRRPPSPP